MDDDPWEVSVHQYNLIYASSSMCINQAILGLVQYVAIIATAVLKQRYKSDP